MLGKCHTFVLILNLRHDTFPLTVGIGMLLSGVSFANTVVATFLALESDDLFQTEP